MLKTLQELFRNLRGGDYDIPVLFDFLLFSVRWWNGVGVEGY